MPIQIHCEECGSWFGASADAVAGKCRCPHCRAVNVLPRDAVEVSAAPGPDGTADLIRIDTGDPSESAGSVHSPERAWLEGDGEPSDDPWAEPTDRCPHCGAAFEISGVQCIHCGYNRSLGRVVTTQVHRRDALRDLLGVGPVDLGLGLGVAVACAGIWTGLVVVTGLPLTFFAVVVGAAVTLVIADRAGDRSRCIGLTSAATVLLALVLAKALIGSVALPHLAVTDILSNRQLLASAAYEQMLEAKAFSPELQAAVEDVRAGRTGSQLIDQMPGSLSVRVQQEVEARLLQMDAAQRERAALQLLGRHPELRQLGMTPRPAVTGWELVWFAAALYVSYRLGSKPLRVRRRRRGGGR